MKTGLKALLLIVVVGSVAGIYFLYAPEHASVGPVTTMNSAAISLFS